MKLDCNSGAMAKTLKTEANSTVLVLFVLYVGDFAQRVLGIPHGQAVTIRTHSENTRDLYYFRGHGWLWQDHPDAPVGGTAAFPGAHRNGNGRAGRTADRTEDQADSAGFGQPGTESDYGDPALFRLACTKRGRVDSPGAKARRNRALGPL